MPNHRCSNSDPGDRNLARGDRGCWSLPICCSHLPFLTPGRASPDRYSSPAQDGGVGRRKGTDSPGRQPTSWLGLGGRWSWTARCRAGEHHALRCYFCSEFSVRVKRYSEFRWKRRALAWLCDVYVLIDCTTQGTHGYIYNVEKDWPVLI